MKAEQAKTVTVRHTPRQRVIGIIALAALFGCGVMIGVTMTGGGRRGDPAMDKQCAALAKEIVRVSSFTSFSSSDMEKLKNMNEMYAENCAGRTFEVEEPKTQPKVEDTADKKTCEVIEELLGHWLNDETTLSEDDHVTNIDVYKKLVENGCPENVEKYNALIAREQDILAALTGSGAMTESAQTCAEIERLLTERIIYCGSAYDSECHIQNAKVYANMSERGCAENQQHYVDLAAKELEIARALQDDDFSDSERKQISDTYKRIQMKQTANEIMNKVQRLTDPAIDFIIQAQKIIEE